MTQSDREHQALSIAYERYVDAISKAHELIQDASFLSNSDQSIGREFVASVTTWSVQQAIDLSPEQPLMHVLHPNVRVGFNNPDNLYYQARVSEQRSYRIEGRRGTSTGFVLQTMKGLPGNGPAAGATLASIASDELRLDPNGEFVVILSSNPPTEGNWLPMRPGTDNLLVRFSFLDWQHEKPGSIRIKCFGIERPQLEITPSIATTMLDDAAANIVLQTQFYRDQGTAITALGSNQFLGPRRPQGQQGTHPHQWNTIGNFDLRSNQALVMTIKDVPRAKYANIMTATPFFDSLPFVANQSSLNRNQVHVDSDGCIRYVVSATDPHVPNWLDTVGTHRGVIFARWQDVEGDLGPEYSPTITVVDVGELRQILPQDTPIVRPEERAERLALRAESLAARFRGADPARPELLNRLAAIESLLGRNLPTQYLADPTL